MKIVITGAGSVGRSIARELISHGHEVALMDRSPDAMRIASVPDADWQLADACDVDALAEAGAGECDVIVSATGDDKANLVTSLRRRSASAPSCRCSPFTSPGHSCTNSPCPTTPR